MKFITKRSSILLILLLLISVPSFFVLLKPGFYEPHDLHHIADIYQMVRAIQSGQIPPRLGPDFSFGYGYPLFNYYYLLPFYLGSLFWYVVGSLTVSFKLVMISGIVLSVYGMYLFLKELTDDFSALVGSVLYLYTPYRAVQIYVRGAVGEVLIMAILPFAAWSFLKIVKKPSAKLIAISSIILSLFFLSHNYLSFASLPVILLLVSPYIIKSKKPKKILLSLLAVVLISLGITAYWWAPALVEQKFMPSITPFPLIDHFPFIKQLLLPSWGYGASLWGPGDGLSFQIGIVNLVSILALFIVLLFYRKRLSKNLFYLSLITMFLFFLSFIFMNIRTLPVWKLIPFYNFIQFPWRLLMYTTFVTAIAAALVIHVIRRKYKYLIGFILIIGCICLTVAYFKPSSIVQKADDQYLYRFFANRSVSGETSKVSTDYFGYSEDYLLLPHWVEERPSSLPQSKIDLSDGEVISISELSPVSWKTEIETNQETLVSFNSYYFPGWTALVDGQKTEIKIGKPHGQITVSVPEGRHEVLFILKETGFRSILNIISLLFLVVTMYFVFKNDFKKIINK